MWLRSAVLLLAVVIGGPGRASTYWVKRADDAGEFTLRWAIEQANASAGPDRILPDPVMRGRTITLASPLPALVDDYTAIRADIGNDGQPDLVLDGSQLSDGHGLLIEGADHCAIRGLAIVDFPGAGIRIVEAEHCVVRTCHVGVDLAGTTAAPNAAGDEPSWPFWSEIVVAGGGHHVIGGRRAIHRNVVGTGGRGAIVLGESSGNVISGNYVGLSRDGSHSVATGISATGIFIGWGSGNRVGGPKPHHRNIIVGSNETHIWGLRLDYTDDNVVQGNWFGLAADGVTWLSRGHGCYVMSSNRNLIGGPSAGERNVFTGWTGMQIGCYVPSYPSHDNRVEGNYFGLTADGRTACPMEFGLGLGTCGGTQIVGGPSHAHGNWFASSFRGQQICLSVSSSASVLVQHNRFGLLRGRRPVPSRLSRLMVVRDADATITDNLFASAHYGIWCTSPSADARIYRNRFRNLGRAILVQQANTVHLGDLGNLSTDDDGGNVFRRTVGWFVYNLAKPDIKAEGNDFRTTDRTVIDRKIWDQLDDPTVGRVDYEPLAGETPVAAGGRLVVLNALAVPSVGGAADIVFTVTAPAEVTVNVLNLAGRPVASVLRDRSCAAGRQHFLWSGTTSAGVRAPAGGYLVRVRARGAGGEQAQALLRLSLAR